MTRSISYLEVDDHVLAGLAAPSDELEQWRSSLPVEIAERVWAVVAAPAWGNHSSNEGGALTNQSPNVTAQMRLEGIPLILAMTGVVLLLSSVVFGFIAESGLIFALLFGLAITALVATVYLQVSRSGSFSGVFGLSDSGNFAAVQVMIFIPSALLITAGLLPVVYLLLTGLSSFDRLLLPQDDTISSAVIRLTGLAAVFVVGYLAWRVLSPGVVTTLRRARGFLVVKLPTVFTSFLYGKKSSPETAAEKSVPTILTAIYQNSLWIVAAVICGLLVCQVITADQIQQSGVAFQGARRLRVLFAVSQWLGSRPNTLHVAATVLGPAAIAVFVYQIIRISHQRSVFQITIGISIVATAAFLTASFWFCP